MFVAKHNFLEEKQIPVVVLYLEQKKSFGFLTTVNSERLEVKRRIEKMGRKLTEISTKSNSFLALFLHNLVLHLHCNLPFEKGKKTERSFGTINGGDFVIVLIINGWGSLETNRGWEIIFDCFLKLNRNAGQVFLRPFFL